MPIRRIYWSKICLVGKWNRFNNFRALKIGKGDEVIIPVNTFIATALAVGRTGATPIFIDNDRYYFIDTEKIEKNK